MSPTERRRWLAIGLAAFALRAGAAVFTEFRPLFPAYYYHDAAFAENIAADMAAAWRDGRVYTTSYSPPQRVHALLMAVPYAVIGRKPLVNKLINAFLGSASVILLGFALAAAVSTRAGLLTAAGLALWPSHIFYTSQNFKEAAIFAAMYGGLALALPRLDAAQRGHGRAAAGFAALMVLVGLLRSYVLLVACVSVAGGALLALRRRVPGARLILAAALTAPLAYKAASHVIFTTTLPSKTALDEAEANFVREAYNPDDGLKHRPLSPEGVSQFRRLRQRADREYALKSMKREIGSQIYPDARFDDWGDLVGFMPKAAFYVLFMPLPGLYPLEGKLGRWLAAGENVVLLALSLGAVFGAARARLTGARVALLLFFALMTAGSALMEFDLGSASRHKLLYLPMLFPFAAEELLRRRRS